MHRFDPSVMKQENPRAYISLYLRNIKSIYIIINIEIKQLLYKMRSYKS